MSAKPLARAFGTILREARRTRGLSQEALAEIAEFDRTFPSLLERGLREPGLSTFIRLAAALRHSPYELLAATLTAARAARPADRMVEDSPPSAPDTGALPVEESPVPLPVIAATRSRRKTGSGNRTWYFKIEAAHGDRVARWRLRVRVEVLGERPPDRVLGSDADREELRAWIKMAARLPPVVRQVFTVRKVYEQTPGEISSTLGLSDAEVERALIFAAVTVTRCLGIPRRARGRPATQVRFDLEA